MDYQLRDAQQGTEAMFSSSDNLLWLARHKFWLENSHLSDSEIQHLWTQRVAPSTLTTEIPSNGPGHGPVTTTTAAASSMISSPLTSIPMDRRSHTEPSNLRQVAMQTQPIRSQRMKRKLSSPSKMSPFSTTSQIHPLVTTAYPTSKDRLSNDFTPIHPAKLRRTDPNQKRLPCIKEVNVNPYEPTDFIRHNSCQSQTSDGDPQNFLQVYPATLSTCSLNSPISSTPALNDFSDISNSPCLMSRQSSDVGGVLCGGMDQMTIQSQNSDFPDSRSGVQGSCKDVEQPNYSMNLPIHCVSSSFPSLPVASIQTATSNISSISHSIPNMYEVNSMASNVVEDLDLRVGKVDESEDLATARIQSRVEPPATGERLLAPKLSPDTNSIQMLHEQDMLHKSADGRKCQISKTTFIRPSREKLRCNLCNKQPGGFRGEHELRRHTERAHKEERKVWICIDGSDEKTMLASCKACRNRKAYGAYYNAAAHLRRVHFNPKEKGKKGKGASDRAGKGGGSWPPIEELKSKWMIEEEEHVVRNLGLEIEPANQPADDSESSEQSDPELESSSSLVSTQMPDTLSAISQKPVDQSDITAGTGLELLTQWSYGSYDIVNGAMFNNAEEFGVPEHEFSVPAYGASFAQ